MFQARMSEGDPRLYNPSRDCAHNFQAVVELVAARLEDGAWPELDSHLKENDVSMDDLGEACAAFCNFVASAAENPDEKMEEAMRRVGWFDCKPLAQAAFLAVLGTVYAGIYFTGVREATFGGVGPASTVHEVAKAGAKFLAITRVPRWKRRLNNFCLYFSKMFAALRGKA